MGILDGPMRDIAAQLTGLFSDDLSVVTRVERVYSSTTDETTKVRRELGVALPPPSRDGLKVEGSVLETDVMTIAAALAFENAVPPFDPVPGKDAEIHVRISGVDYKAMRVDAVWSGDQIAAYEFVLRK